MSAAPPSHPASHAAPFFLAEGLACARGERAVFRHVSLRLDAGGILLLRGPNGSGKSSLLRMLAGLLPPFAGHLAWHDGPVAQAPDLHAARLVYLGHANAAQPALTVEENLDFWAHLQADGEPSRIPEALDAFALGELADLPARYLSAGQTRRLALARLMLGNAPLWLLDEPATGLDRASTAALWARVVTHRALGGMAVIAVHGEADLPGAAEFDLTPYSLTGQAGAEPPAPVDG